MTRRRWGPELTTSIDAILQQALDALNSAREEVFQIAEAARSEYERLKAALDSLRKETKACIEEVDRLERAMMQARIRLMQVDRDFARSTPAEIQAAYEEAEQVQVALSLQRARERELRRRRDELERGLRTLQAMVERAEGLVSQVNMALRVLTGDVNRLNNELEGLRARFQIGEHVIRAQEEERRRVAREIHDGPAQAMANVVLRAEICERLLAAGRKEVVQELAQLKMLVKESLREVRKIIFNLRPMALDDLGLVPTLNRYFENLREQDDLPVTLRVTGKDRRLHTAIEVAIFRTIQEAVNNARRHAQASRIDVHLEFGPDYVQLVVEDDGIGFDLEEVRREWADRKSFGIMSMKERIELLDGEFTLKSEIGKGTQVRARVKLHEDGDGRTVNRTADEERLK